MRIIFGLILFPSILLLGTGCGTGTEGPSVPSFGGRIFNKDGTPISIPPTSKGFLNITDERARGMKLPLDQDGIFQIRKTPVGKYSATLLIQDQNDIGDRGSPGKRFEIPGGFTIEEGKIEGYELKLGTNYKPKK